MKFKIIKLFFHLSIASVAILAILQTLSDVYIYNLHFESEIYWTLLSAIVLYTYIYKTNSGLILKVGLFLFITGSALSIIQSLNIPETIMTGSYILLVVGITLAIKELMKIQ